MQKNLAMLPQQNGAEMNFTQDDKIFLDTNILCYLYDSREPTKQNLAQELFNDLLSSFDIQISVARLYIV